MSSLGRYHPERVEHVSNLWDYGEVPVASAKLNTWDGNIAAALDFLHRVLVRLAGLAGQAVVLAQGTGLELRVDEQSVPDMSVTVNAGSAVVDGYLCGRDAPARLPASGSFAAPAGAARVDIVCLDAYGQLHVLAGEESGAPVVPDTPSGTLKLAEIHHRGGESSIRQSDDGVNGYLLDCRPLRVVGGAHEHPRGAERAPGESPDGERLQFSTPQRFRAGSLCVWLNGVQQAPGEDFDEDADRQGYTFSLAPHSGDRLSHDYEKEGA